jgi:predicted metalloprotease with PDZ domain
MTTSAARLLSTVLAVFVISPVYAQSSNPLARRSEGMVGRQSPGFLTLQGPGSQIGVSARDLAAAGRQQSSGDWFTSQAGVVIDQVSSWGPASRAGLMKGDVVTIFDGYPVRNVAHFNKLVGETPPGRTVRMTILRGQKTQQLPITPTL